MSAENPQPSEVIKTALKKLEVAVAAGDVDLIRALNEALATLYQYGAPRRAKG